MTFSSSLLESLLQSLGLDSCITLVVFYLMRLLSLGATRLFLSNVLFQNLHQYMPSDTRLPTQSVGAQRSVCTFVCTTGQFSH